MKLLYIFLFLSGNILAQLSTFSLSKGNCQLYKGHLYAYGFKASKNQTALCVYKLDFQLQKKDSVIIEHLKTGMDNYLMMYSDTLHDFLNIYSQKKDGKAVSIYRFDANLKNLATVEEVDVARLNNTAMFGVFPFYFKNSVYSIKTHSDTSGKQFYINKYELKNGSGNFEYEQKWQFPFERKFIHSAKVFYVTTQHVYCFVTVSGGKKSGEWLLKLYANDGKLLKGIKLNDKTESAHYFFGNYSVNPAEKSLQLIGQKMSESQFNMAANKINIANLPALTVYYINIDSLDEISWRQDIKIPVVDVKSGVKKTNPSFLLRFTHLYPKQNGNIVFETDIYKSDANPFCYYYTNSNSFKLKELDEKLILEKNSIGSNLQIESYYLTADKLDLNGKLCTDSIANFEQLFYKQPTLPVKLHFKSDELNNPLWVLSKSNLKKNSIQYSLLLPVKKIYEVKLLEDIQKSNHPTYTSLGNKSFVIGYENGDGALILKLFNW